jgi:hypothetical protein
MEPSSARARALSPPAAGCRAGARLWLCAAADGAARDWLRRSASRIWDGGAALVFLLPHRIRRDNLLRSAALAQLQCLDGGAVPLFSTDDAPLIGFVAESSGLDAARLWQELSARAASTSNVSRDSASARTTLMTESSKWNDFLTGNSSALQGLRATITTIQQAEAQRDQFDTDARERRRQALQRAERAQEALLADTGYIFSGEQDQITLSTRQRDDLLACCRIIQRSRADGRAGQARHAPHVRHGRISRERRAYLEQQLASGAIDRPDDISYQEGDEYFWRRIPRFSTWRPWYGDTFLRIATTS